MKRLLLALAVPPAFLCLAASAPAKSQVAFESIYAQAADMVDGIEVGARIIGELSAATYASATVVAAAQPPGRDRAAPSVRGR